MGIACEDPTFKCSEFTRRSDNHLLQHVSPQQQRANVVLRTFFSILDWECSIVQINRTSRPNDQHSCFVLVGWQIRISARRQAILTGIFHGTLIRQLPLPSLSFLTHSSLIALSTNPVHSTRS